MLVLADAGFDAIGFLRGIHATGAQFLVRSSATRRPLVQDRLPDGSYLTRQVTTASGILPSGTAQLVGTIGRALLDNLLPTHRRQRLKARSLKSHSKYAPNTAQHPATAQTYTFHTEIAITEKGLAPRSHR